MPKKFSYTKCIQKVNELISPSETKLPIIDKKSTIMANINKYVRENIPPMLYRYTSIDLDRIPNILKGEIYLLPAAKMNDVFEAAPYGECSPPNINAQEINRCQEELYLKSFTYAQNNILMWSHYGDSNKGICIGYDFREASNDVVRHLYPVQYSDTRFSDVIAQNIASHPFLCLRKSKCWEYEKEFRLIYPKHEIPDDQIIFLNCIKEVQFGCHVPQQQIDMIKELVAGTIIKLYRTRQKEHSFELTKEEL